MTEEYFNRKPDPGCLRLFLVRHGETDANRKRYLQGTSNGLLNECGIRQAEKLSRHLRTTAIDYVYASDLQRAVDTARAIAQVHRLEVKIDSELREWNVGELDGIPATIFLQMIKDSGKPISEFLPPGGDQLDLVLQRAQRVIARIIEEHMGQSIIICSHGDFMRMMFGAMMKLTIETASAVHFDNASYSVFEFSEQQWKILTINRVAVNCE
jgi:broad specificity phosphatase PhoE